MDIVLLVSVLVIGIVIGTVIGFKAVPKALFSGILRIDLSDPDWVRYSLSTTPDELIYISRKKCAYFKVDNSAKLTGTITEHITK